MGSGYLHHPSGEIAMDSLDESIKRLIKQAVKEAVSEALREALRDFQISVPARTERPSAPKPIQSKKLAVKIDEAAEMLSLSTITIRRLIANGSLKASRKTRHLLIPIEEVKRMMELES